MTARGSNVGGLLLLVGLAAASASAAEPVRPTDLIEATSFLETYRAASEAHRPDFYDLYSDRAIVHVSIRAQASGAAFQGRAFKAWGQKLLADRQAVPDVSAFRDVTVEQRGKRLVIRAKRYSLARCFWDSQYLVAIEREGASHRIVEEHLTMDPSARCGLTADGLDAPSYHARPEPAAPLLNIIPPPAVRPDWHPLSAEAIEAEATRRVLEEQQRRGEAALERASVVRASGEATRMVAPEAVSSELHVTP
jgi:hypothetical protein